MMKSIRGINVVIALLLIWLLLPGVQMVLAAPGAGSIAQVWEREEEYWRYVKAADVEDYIMLWHKDFVGWPSGQDYALPRRPSAIGFRIFETRRFGLNQPRHARGCKILVT
jgi:hypothetical protein